MIFKVKVALIVMRIDNISLQSAAKAAQFFSSGTCMTMQGFIEIWLHCNHCRSFSSHEVYYMHVLCIIIVHLLYCHVQL